MKAFSPVLISSCPTYSHGLQWRIVKVGISNVHIYCTSIEAFVCRTAHFKTTYSAFFRGECIGEKFRSNDRAKLAIAKRAKRIIDHGEPK